MATRDNSIRPAITTAAGLLRARPSTWPLSVKVIVALALALLPLGILAIIAAVDTYRDVRDAQTNIAASRLAALERSLRANSDEDLVLLQTLLLMDVSTPPLRANCADMLTRAAQFDTRISSLARIDARGQLVCASAGAPLPSMPLARTMLASPPEAAARFVQAVFVDENSTDRDLVLVVRDNGAASVGHALLARIPRQALQTMLDTRTLDPGEMLRLTIEDEVVAAWGTDAGLLDVLQASAKHGSDRAVQRVDSFDGRQWFYGTSDLTVRDARLAFARPAEQLTVTQALSIAFPALMWLAALLIGWLAIDRLVVGPLVQMRRAVERYGAGDPTIRLGLQDYDTQEMAMLASSFDRMADQITSHEDELRGALATQKRLTREVHHRVKNNLQIVSSLLSLQSRDAKSPEVAAAYAMIQKRVNALALVHRWMYDDETMQGVDLRSLANDLCAGLEQSIGASANRQVSINSDVERIYVGQDTAVPLAFLITELVAAASRLTTDAEPFAMRVGARATDTSARLEVAAPAFRGIDRFAAGSGDPSARIIQGMARQMRSRLEHDPEHGCYMIAFPLARLAKE